MASEHSDGREAQPRSAKWAEARTDWAEDRTILAVERTFAGWMRTAFGAIGIGLAFRVLFGAFDPPWLARGIATLFILLGALTALGAERRACKSFEKLNTHKVERADTPNLRWVAWTIAAASCVLIAGLWVLNDGRLTD